jgi:hypothetical protein
MVYVWTHCDFESIFNIHNRKLGTSLVGYELEKVRIDMESVYRSRLLRIRFSADLTMYWFPVCHFRCKEFKSLVIWIRNQNIAISTIVGTSSHIIFQAYRSHSLAVTWSDQWSKYWTSIQLFGLPRCDGLVFEPISSSQSGITVNHHEHYSASQIFVPSWMYNRLMYRLKAWIRTICWNIAS